MNKIEKKKCEKNEAKLKKENKDKIKFKKSYGSCRTQSMSVSLNLQYIGLYLKGSLNILVSFLERTILFRSCYVLLPLHRFKLFSKYSIYHLIIQPKIFFTCCCSHVSLCENNSLFNFEHRRLCLPALCMYINIHFGLICRDDAFTWRNIIPVRRDSSFGKTKSQF